MYKKLITIFFILFVIFTNAGCNSKENLSSYDINVILNENELLCEMQLNYVNNNKKSVSELYFCLYPNAYSKDAEIKPIRIEQTINGYPNGESYGGINIKNVKNNDKNATYSISTKDQNILKVQLDNPVKYNESCKIDIDFDVIIPNCLHRLGYGDNTLNLSNFHPILCEEYNGEVYKSVYYPTGDPFYSSVANYNVSLTVPSTYVVASSLSPTGTECMGEKTRYIFSREKVRDISFVLSKKFNILKEKVGETDLFYYYFSDKNPEKSFDVIKDSFSFYNKIFIKYPYSEYVVCEADFIYGGMEYPCLTIVNARLLGEEKEYAIAHETAHQWWYGIVGVNQSEEGFIDEGLTEFSTLLFMEKYTGKKRSEQIEQVKEKYREIRKYTVHLNNGKSAKMLRNLGSFTSDSEYVSIAYYRSQIMFDELFNFLGQKQAFKFFKGLLTNYKYKNLTYNELRNFAKKIKSGAEKVLDGYVLGEKAI